MFYDLFSDEELVQLVQSGDESAFNRLCVNCDRFISFYGAKYVMDSYTKEDILQEGRQTLWMCARAFDPDRGVKFSTYFVNALNNRFLKLQSKYIRDSKYVSYLPILSADEYNEEGSIGLNMDEVLVDDHDPEKAYLEKEEKEYMRRLFDENLTNYENTVLTKYMEGYKPGDIALILGENTKSVANAIFRAKTKIHQVCYINN